MVGVKNGLLLLLFMIRFPISRSNRDIIWRSLNDGKNINIRSEPFLLSFSSFMILEPIKHIFSFNLTVLSQPSRDPLNLFSTWRSNSIVVVKILQYSYLVCCWCPPCTTLSAHKTTPFSTTATSTIFLIILLLLLRLFHLVVGLKTRRKQRQKNKRKEGR